MAVILPTARHKSEVSTLRKGHFQHEDLKSTELIEHGPCALEVSPVSWIGISDGLRKLT